MARLLVFPKHQRVIKILDKFTIPMYIFVQCILKIQKCTLKLSICLFVQVDFEMAHS